MKVFIDTNILIDFIARRDQFYYPAANLINLGILKPRKVIGP